MRHLILVVDDEPAIRDVLSQLLEDEGYRVQSADDGQAALDMAAREAPDVIVSDVTMPGVGGVELVRSLRRRGQNTPVVLMSARYDCVALPGVQFLPKPFDVDTVVDAIEHCLPVATA